MGVQDNPPPCRSYSSSSLLLLPGFHLTTRSSLTDLEPRMSTSIRTCEPPSAMIAWKSQSQAMEEPRSISPTGWVGSETVGGFNGGIMNDDYTDGIICPYEIPDQWQYEYDRQWFVDPTLRFVCTKFRNADEA